MPVTKRLYLLSLISFTIRYGFWGVANLLVLYLVLEHNFVLEKAAVIYGLFVGVGAFLPFLGGIIADRCGDKWLIISSLFCSMVGAFLLIIHRAPFFFFGLLLLSCSYGFSVVSLFSLLNAVYKGHDHLRESGFSIYYCFGTAAAFFGVIVIGFLAHAFGWALGWGSITLFSFLGLLPAFYYFKKIPSESGNGNKNTFGKGCLAVAEVKKLIFISILALLSFCFWAAYSQGWSSMSVFAIKNISTLLQKWGAPLSWVFSLESLFLMLLTPLFVKLYVYLDKSGNNPSSLLKFAFSFLALCICFTLLVIGALLIDIEALSFFMLVGAYFFMAIGEILMGPIGFSLVTELAPAKIRGIVTGGWFVVIGLAYYFGGYVAVFFNLIGAWQFFLLLAFSALILAVLLIFLRNWLRALLL